MRLSACQLAYALASNSALIEEAIGDTPAGGVLLVDLDGVYALDRPVHVRRPVSIVCEAKRSTFRLAGNRVLCACYQDTPVDTFEWRRTGSHGSEGLRTGDEPSSAKRILPKIASRNSGDTRGKIAYAVRSMAGRGPDSLVINASTVATIPALAASGRCCQAITTCCRSGGRGISATPGLALTALSSRSMRVIL